MWLGAALVFVGTLLGAARAEATVRWELKPKVPPANSLALPLPLADGRLLLCTETDGAQGCHVLDPGSGERIEVPVSGPAHRFESALALDDGNLLLVHEHALLDLFSGKKRTLPPAARQLSELRGVAIAGGRAAFVARASCERVLFFMGAEAGFRDVVAAPAGTCVRAVFDLGDGRVLIARETASKKGDDWHIDFVSFDLASFRFQLGPRLTHRHPVAAFVHRGEIVVLLHNTYRRAKGGIRSEALFIDRNMKRRSFLVFHQASIGRQVARVDDDHWLIFDEAGSLLWDPTHGTLARVPFPARSSAYFAVLRRAGTVFAFFYQARDMLALSRVASRPDCAEVVTYAANASAERSEVHPPERLDELLSPDAIESCRHHLESTQRLPESIQLPLEALLQRRQGVAPREEQVAARVLCTLLPKHGLALVQRISAGGHLDDISAKLCQKAEVVVPVLTEAGTPRVARALVRHGLAKASGGVHVRWEVQRLLEERPELAQQAGPFLREAHAQKAEGFDTLHMALCTSHATGELALACTEIGSDRERDFRPSPPNKERPRLLRNLGIATGVIGGLTALAYLDRDGGGGRALAIGSGVVGGATLGFVGTIALSEPAPDMEGLGTLLLAAAVGAGGAIAGGALTTLTSREPGAGRFASAAVPLGGVWLTAVGLTIDGW
jgi:hypothetical protein